MTLTTVYRALNPAEGQLVRSRLAAEGFTVFVQHELASLSLDGYAQAAGGILIQVPSAEADEARELLAAPPLE